MNLLKYLPENSNIAFVNKRAPALLFTGLLMLASITSLVFHGLNFGIDFTGGVQMEVQAPGVANLDDIRHKLSEAGFADATVNTIDKGGQSVMIRLSQQEGGDKAQSVAVDKVKSALGDTMKYKSTSTVGPKVGAELVASGALAVALAIVGITAYIWVRFEWPFAVGALAATIHDVITTLGLFSLLHLEFDLTTVAALLTIAGYSVNDTVVQYDRVRENLRRYKKLELPALIDRSLNEVLTRTLLTSITTFLVTLALVAFGGSVLRTFSVALSWGVVIGTYSSFYVAMPLLIYLNLRGDSVAKDDDEVVEKKAAG